MGSPRPASSVYSNSFELEELLESLSDQVWKQGTHVFLSLEKEREDIESELVQLRAIRGCIDAAMAQMNGRITQLYTALADARRSIQQERIYWVSNCTAF